MAARAWIKTKHPGVRYREHPERRHAGKADRYFTLRYTVDGKEYEDGLGWSSEGWNADKAAGILAKLKEAKRFGVGPRTLAEMRAQAEAERQAESLASRLADARMITFDELKERYLAVTEKKPNRKTEKCRFERYLSPRFGAMPLESITRRHVIDLREHLLTETGLAPETVRQILSLLRHTLSFARDTYVDRDLQIPLLSGPNPAAGVRLETSQGERVVIDNARVRFFTREQAEEHLRAAREFPQPLLHDASLLSLFTGLRRGEIRQTLRMHYDLDHATLNLPAEIAKIREGAKLPLNDRVLEMLCRRCQGLSPGDPVFPSSPDALTKLMHELCDKLGTNGGVNDPRQRIVFHSWRHTYASWLAMQGTDLLIIRELMRHKTIEMTMRYAHLLPDGKRAAVAALARCAQGV